MSERRYLAPLPLGGDDGPPWSKGLMSRALAATGLTVTRAYELARRAEADIEERGTDRLDLDRLAELAVRGSRRGRGRPHDAAAAAAACAAPARRPDHPARRRRDGHRQVDDRHRGGAPARDHAGHVDGLHPPDDARVLLAGVHAVGALLELRGRARAHEGGGGRGGRRALCSGSSTRRGTCSSASKRRSTARSPRAGRWCSRASTSSPGWSTSTAAARSSSQCVVAIEDEDLHRSHFWVRDHATEGLRPLEKYLDGDARDPADPGCA